MSITLTPTKLISGITIIIVIGVSIGVLVTYLLLRPKPQSLHSLAVKTSGPVPKEQADSSIRAYRHPEGMGNLARNWEGWVEGIVHDTTSFMYLYKNIFIKFADSHTELGERYKNCEWRLGLYPNIIYSDAEKKQPRLNIYFIPTLWDKQRQEAIDYYKIRGDRDAPYYHSTNKDLWKDNDPFIFDQGTLFP